MTEAVEHVLVEQDVIGVDEVIDQQWDLICRAAENCINSRAPG